MNDLNLVVPKSSDIVVLQPLRWRYVECVVHHERDVCEEQ